MPRCPAPSDKCAQICAASLYLAVWFARYGVSSPFGFHTNDWIPHFTYSPLGPDADNVLQPTTIAIGPSSTSCKTKPPPSCAYNAHTPRRGRRKHGRAPVWERKKRQHSCTAARLPSPCLAITYPLRKISGASVRPSDPPEFSIRLLGQHAPVGELSILPRVPCCAKEACRKRQREASGIASHAERKLAPFARSASATQVPGVSMTLHTWVHDPMIFGDDPILEGSWRPSR